MTSVKFLVWAVLLLALSGTAHAQRYLPRQIGIQITGGTLDGFLLRNKEGEKRFYGSLALSRYNSNRSRWIFSADYLQRDYRYEKSLIPKAQFIAGIGYYYPVAADRSRNTFFFSLGVSGIVGYETSNWGDKLLPDGATIRNRDGTLYGGALGAEIETFLADRLAVLVQVKESYTGGSAFGKFQTQIGVGVKIIIN